MFDRPLSTPVKSPSSSSTGNLTPSSSISPTNTYGSYLHSYFLDQQNSHSTPSSSVGVLVTNGTSSLVLAASSPQPQPRGGEEPSFCAYGLGIDLLYVREIKSIISALSSPQPLSGKMYWVSTSWMANAKKYYEALPLPEVGASDGRRGKASHKRSAKIRVRRGSDALPPWPQINGDLVCPHGRLSLAKTPKGKRRLLSAAAWRLLRKFYPSGPAYPAGAGSGGTVECPLCARQTDAAKQVQVEQRERELTRRAERIPADLQSLLSRKSGVPTGLLVRRRALYVESVVDPLPSTPQQTKLTAASGIGIVGVAITASRSSLAGGGGGGGGSPGYGAGLSSAGELSTSPPPPLHGGLSLQPVDFERPIRPPLASRAGGLPSSTSSAHSSSTDLSLWPVGGSMERSPSKCSLESRDSLSVSDFDSSDGDWDGYGYGDFDADFDGLIAEQMGELGLSQRDDAALPNYPYQLLPGMYHLVPRSWLRKWRHHVKDASAAVPLLDCTSLLCHSHGLCVVPPHLTEFLLGVRKSLLGGLGQYPGEIVEIISLEEWEALHEQLKSFPDFGVRFSLEPEGELAWNVGLCQACDPFNYGNLSPSPNRRVDRRGSR